MELSEIGLGRIFLIIVTFLAVQTESQDRSICPYIARHWTTQYVSYRETYKKRSWGVFWKTATRINYRIEGYWKHSILTKCCDGYIKRLDNPLTCLPECRTGCPGGLCSEPNVCSCFSGYRNPTLQDRSTCVPNCDGDAHDPKDCGEHGRCIGPKKCQCVKGYSETFESLTNRNFCVPKCDPACGDYGFCHGPNDCRCDAGYRLGPTRTHSKFQECEPICDHDCVNGVCQAPNICSCLPGYKQHLQNHFLCQPVCKIECIHANCTKPDHCECYPGYEKNVTNPTGMCSPICDLGCINGVCTRPNYCECHRGYRAISTQSNAHCVPICDPPCINGNCTEPGICTCHVGHGKNANEPHHKCSPVCDPPCINGECTQPNHCECHQHYKEDPTNTAVCLPVCHPPCINATCVKPDTCECSDGHGKSTEKPPHVCSPICDPPCINAECARPNHCECLRGYALDPAGSIHQCSPVCDPACINAICQEPNVCQCLDGYRNSLDRPRQHCSPVCDPACDSNSFCHSPNQCNCNKGYVEDESFLNSKSNSTIVCQPFCQPECIENASCIAPDQCQCNPGYQPAFASDQKSNPMECLPVCEKNCLHGFCGYPNKCVCHSGYRMSADDKFTCDPHCEHDCINAKCTRPNYCECFSGYEKVEDIRAGPHHDSLVSDNICIPHCPADCLSCIAPNQCTCHPGYVLTDSKSNSSLRSCQPSCEPACPSGWECVAPNQCQLPDDIDQDDTEISTTEQDVYNSTGSLCPDSGNFLEGNETCSCKNGWSGSGCDEPTFCIIRIMNDNETDNEFYTQLSDAIDNNQTNEETEYEEANELLTWQAPDCDQRCRISLLEVNIKNQSEIIIHCHREMLPVGVNESVTTEDPSLTSDTNNTSIVCFIKAESECSISKKHTIPIQGVPFEVVGGIASGIIVVALMLVALVSFIVIRKKKNAKELHASHCNSITIKWTDGVDHNCVVESSTL